MWRCRQLLLLYCQQLNLHDDLLRVRWLVFCMCFTLSKTVALCPGHGGAGSDSIGLPMVVEASHAVLGRLMLFALQS
jgi:hypothetical protein